MKCLLNRQCYQVVLFLLCAIVLPQHLFAQIEVFIVPNMDKSDTFKTMEPAARKWFELNRKSDDKENQQKYIRCKKNESGTLVIVVCQRTWIDRAGSGGAAKPETVIDDPTEESTNIQIETIEGKDKIAETPAIVASTAPAPRQRRVEIASTELFPSGNTGTRSFRSVVHKSGLITMIETGPNERIVEIKADLSITHLGKGTEVTNAGREFVQTLGKANDDAGHVIAQRLGGSGGANMDNLFPQLPNINREAFAQWEAQIAKWVQDTKNKVSIQITFNYDKKSSRPISIDYPVTVNGVVHPKT